MGTMFGLGGGLVALMVAVFVAILAILWIMLPFAVFGIRKRVDASTALQEQLLHELKMANYLTKLAHGLREETGADGVTRIVRP